MPRESVNPFSDAARKACETIEGSLSTAGSWSFAISYWMLAAAGISGATNSEMLLGMESGVYVGLSAESPGK